MKAPLYKRIFKTDYKQDQQELVDKLAGSVNDGIEGLQGILNKNVSLGDNIYCIVKDIPVTVDANGFPKQSVSFSNTLANNIIGMNVIQAINNTNSNVFPTGAPFITFSENQRVIFLNHITGLPANNKFTLRIVAYG